MNDFHDQYVPAVVNYCKICHTEVRGEHEYCSTACGVKFLEKSKVGKMWCNLIFFLWKLFTLK